MSELLKKHKESCEAAENLFTRDRLYASSVHCAYYSCIQLMTYTLYNKVTGFNKARYEADIKGKGSHDILRQRIKDALTSKGVDSVGTSSFDSTLKQLKSARIKADYKDEEISEYACKIAQKQSVQVNGIIKTTFSIS